MSRFNATLYALAAAALVVAAHATTPPAQGERRARASVVQVITSAGFEAAGKVDFVRDIQPLFQSRCSKCHGPDKQRGQLRFDSKPSVMAGGKSGKLLIPGHSADSYLIKRVQGQGDEPRMPFKSTPLTADEIGLLKAWIDQGAEYPDSASVAGAAVSKNWAYVKPIRPPVPAVEHAGWAKNPIDAFILARLEKEGLNPSPEAPREELIRRASLDLVGLPPTPAEVDAFLNDKSPDAYEKVVDRLLTSPHYGERWAIPWLDLARYADSNGYEKDRIRSMWPYRDWVIHALNSDMPFSNFTVQQLAGDLLPGASDEQKIATGFHRNTMLNEEGGVDPDEYLYYAEVDRANTTATVWLGSTLGCAQCHNHKYDPFTQKDYYQLLAYFSSTAEETTKGRGTDPYDVSPKLTVPTEEAKALREQIAAIEHKMAAPAPELEESEARWEAQRSQAVEWATLNITSAKSSHGATLEVQPDGAVLATGKSPDTDTCTLTAAAPVGKITAIRLEALPDDGLPSHGPGRAPNGNFVLTHFAVTATPKDGKPARLKLGRATADFSQESWPVEAAATEKPNNNTGWAVVPKTGEAHTAVFELATDLASEDGMTLTFTLQQSSTFPQHTLGRLRLSVASAGRDRVSLSAAAPLPENVARIVATPRAERDEKQLRELTEYYRTIAPELSPMRDEIIALRKRMDSGMATTLVMQELGKPRPSFIHLRGGFLTVGDKVQPGIPAIFRDGARSAASEPTTQPDVIQNRVDLARWLVSDDNPLTARVTVNRIWEQYFGKGIVATSEDFGTQGEPPSHPELLDWLATEFMSQHWSMKAVHRLIATSATYRQSSVVTPALLEKDPDNRLLARGARFRLPAELVRDEALAASGLLSQKVGGPSVFPPQPAGIWRSPYSGDQWKTSEGEDRYRRGIYTFLRRSAPYPAFMSFDKTTHEAVCTRRSRTDTSMQALTTLNDPAFVEAAAALARRIVGSGGDNDESRCSFAFRAVLCRKPLPDELKRVEALHEQMRAAFADDPKAAENLANTGALPKPEGASIQELAAWTAVSNVLFNLDEALTKE